MEANQPPGSMSLTLLSSGLKSSRYCYSTFDFLLNLSNHKFAHVMEGLLLCHMHNFGLFISLFFMQKQYFYKAWKRSSQSVCEMDPKDTANLGYQGMDLLL